MSFLLTSPAAHLVGAGMQAVGIGIPIGQVSGKVIDGMRNIGLPVPPKTWFKCCNKQQQQQQQDGNSDIRRSRSASPSVHSQKNNKEPDIYDKLERHINGIAKVAKPAIEIKKMIREGCCGGGSNSNRYAVPVRARSQSPQGRSQYYHPEQQYRTNRRSDYVNRSSRSNSPEEMLSKRKIKFHHHHRHERSESQEPVSKKRNSRRRRLSSDDYIDSCLQCSSRSRSLLELPCGNFICTKCDRTGRHERDCKQCKKLLN